jgi:hypothetical protein
MKKALTVMALLAGAASVYSQGQVSLVDYGSTTSIQVFNSQSVAASTTSISYGGYNGQEEMGNSANPNLFAPGTTSYAAGSALGTGYSIQLLAAAGTGDAISSLVANGPVVTTWYTAAGGDPTTGFNGLWLSGANATISGVGVGSGATVAIAAWNNEAGTVGSLGAAQAANAAAPGSDPWGISATGNIASLGGPGGGTPSSIPGSITGFSLVAGVPEPSTIALGVIGASAFLMRLRRKQ